MTRTDKAIDDTNSTIYFYGICYMHYRCYRQEASIPRRKLKSKNAR